VRVLRESVRLMRPLGLGIDRFRMHFGMIKSKEFERMPTEAGVLYDTPHNIYWNNLLSWGYIPFLIWLYILLRGLWAIKDKSYRVSLAAYALIGLASFDTWETNLMAYMLLARGVQDG